MISLLALGLGQSDNFTNHNQCKKYGNKSENKSFHVSCVNYKRIIENERWIENKNVYGKKKNYIRGLSWPSVVLTGWERTVEKRRTSAKSIDTVSVSVPKNNFSKRSASLPSFHSLNSTISKPWEIMSNTTQDLMLVPLKYIRSDGSPYNFSLLGQHFSLLRS